jgi:hypothetical protein
LSCDFRDEASFPGDELVETMVRFVTEVRVHATAEEVGGGEQTEAGAGGDRIVLGCLGDAAARGDPPPAAVVLICVAYAVSSASDANVADALRSAREVLIRLVARWCGTTRRAAEAVRAAEASMTAAASEAGRKECARVYCSLLHALRTPLLEVPGKDEEALSRASSVWVRAAANETIRANGEEWSGVIIHFAKMAASEMRSGYPSPARTKLFGAFFLEMGRAVPGAVKRAAALAAPEVKSAMEKCMRSAM